MRCRWRYALASACVIALTRLAVSQDKPPLGTPGDLVDRRGCDPPPAYDAALSQWPFKESPASERPGRSQYLTALQNLTCSRITYLSDGLRIVGFINHPRAMPLGRRYPVIINLRGGTGDDGSLPPHPLYSTAQMVASGFVVLSTQYRGAGGSEGRDEHGGADLADVLNLFPLLRRLEYADTANIFLLGSSRGGTMALLALRAGVHVRAAAIKYAPTDYRDWLASRPDMEILFRAIVPGFERDREAALTRRSATAWAEELHVPLLILHGSADERVPAREALRFAERLQALGKEYELVLYAGDTHGLPAHATDAQERVLRWFRMRVR